MKKTFKQEGAISAKNQEKPEGWLYKLDPTNLFGPALEVHTVTEPHTLCQDCNLTIPAPEVDAARYKKAMTQLLMDYAKKTKGSGASSSGAKRSATGRL